MPETEDISRAEASTIHRRDPLGPRLRAGRMRLALYIAGTLMLTVLVIMYFLTNFGTERLPVQIGRLALTITLMCFLWIGSPVARWITIVLLGIAGALSLPLLLMRPPPVFLATIQTLMAVTYVPFVVELVRPTAVRDFVFYQQARNKRH